MTEVLFPQGLAVRFAYPTELGRGYRKVAWKAFDKNLAQWVAVKTFLEGGIDQQVEELKSVLAGLQHPNLVGVLNMGTVDQDGRQMVFLVEELLDWVFDKLSPVRPTHLLTEYLIGLATGLAYLHSPGAGKTSLVHRDLKPDNCGLLDGTPKLFDFGTVSSPGLTPASLKWGFCGTRPIELMRSPTSIDSYGPEQDVWAFGATAYFMATGAFPFLSRDEITSYHEVAALLWPKDGSTPSLPAEEAKERAIADKAILAAEKWKPEDDPRLADLNGLGTVIGRCLDVDPDRRPVASDLPGLIGGAAAALRGARTLGWYAQQYSRHLVAQANEMLSGGRIDRVRATEVLRALRDAQVAIRDAGEEASNDLTQACASVEAVVR